MAVEESAVTASRSLSADDSRQAGAKQGLTIAVSSFLPIMVVMALPPALPSMIAAFGGTPRAATLVPWLVTIPGLVVALLAPFAGWIIDRYGRRGPLLLATLLYTVTGILPAFLPDLGWTVVSRIGIGIAQAFILITTTALFADYFSPDQRRTWLTFQGLSTTVLATGSVMLAGALAAQGWQYTFLVYAGGVPILIAMALFCFEPERIAPAREDQAAAQPFPWRTGAWVCGVTLFASVFFFLFIIYSGVALKAAGVDSVERIGTLIGVMGLGAPFGAILFNVASRRLTIGQMIAIMFFLMGLGVFGAGLTQEVGVMLAFGFLQQIGGGMTMATLVFWGSQAFPTEHRGRGFGLWNTAFFIGQFICPPIVTLGETATGGLLPAFVLLGCVAMAAALATFFLRGLGGAPGKSDATV